MAGSVVLAAQQAVVILPDGTLMPLGFLPNGNFSQANGISGKMVVGYSSTGQLALQTRAFHSLARGRGSVDLDTLGSRFSVAVAVNITRQVIGDVKPPGRGQRGFVWTPSGSMQELSVFPGDEASAARY